MCKVGSTRAYARLLKQLAFLIFSKGLEVKGYRA